MKVGNASLVQQIAGYTEYCCSDSWASISIKEQGCGSLTNIDLVARKFDVDLMFVGCQALGGLHFPSDDPPGKVEKGCLVGLVDYPVALVR